MPGSFLLPVRKDIIVRDMLKVYAFGAVYKAKIIGKEKIFVKFLFRPRTDGEKVSFYK